MRHTLWMLAIGVLLLGCVSGEETNRDAELRVVVWDQYIGWDEVVGELDAETADWVTSFAASVPETLPELALPQVHFVDAGLGRPLSGDFVLQPDEDGIVEARLVIGNPSYRANRTESVVCLRNFVQVACGRDADVWELAVPAEAVALLPVAVEGSAGDRIDMLLIPSEQTGYPFPFSVSFLAFIGHSSHATALTNVAATERVWPFEECGIARILHDRPPLDMVRNPSVTQRDAELFLLIESCEPEETVRLVAIGDRRRVVQIDEPEWRSPVRVTGETALLRVDLSWFSDVDEFQIVVIRDVFGNGHGPVSWFSGTISFEEVSFEE